MAAAETQRTDPLWYKDAVIYELHVKCFADSNGDGIGDFAGLIDKLDYLADLGVTAIWLLPFYPSPLLDDGYDIADYFRIHPDYGNLKDFRRLLREAHKRDLRVIIELVINHTSDQHKWFQRARRAKPGSVRRDFYVWSDSPEKYKDARIIFKDFENSNWTWDPVAGAYYWHRFYSHQPDLNFDNPRVRKEIFRAVDFWFNMGVDGMRLDAVPYLFEREDTNCENLSETHQFLKDLRAHVDGKFHDRMLLAEANQWPDDAAVYFGEGDECHMAFHFPVMPRLFMALQMEDQFPIVDMLEQSLNIPETCQWAMFLRNHDELTLEMVTDEERDYMYRAYAEDPRARINLGIRRRLAPLLNNNRRKIELMNMLLLSLPGTPIVYYGDEIGMGDNYYLGDRDGVRTPMQWSPDRNAGFSCANPQKLYLPVVIDSQYHFAAINVENENSNLSSLLWFMRRLIATRKRFKAFGRGGIQFIPSDNARVLAFTRQYEDETILVVTNLSRFCELASLRLSEYANLQVEEVFSSNTFPAVSEQPYMLTMGPHNCYWFLLKQREQPVVTTPEELPELKLRAAWANIMQTDSAEQLVELLKNYIQQCRWFAGKGKRIRYAAVADSICVRLENKTVHFLLLRVTYRGAPQETYAVPVGFAAETEVLKIAEQNPQSVIARLQLRNEQGIMYDAAFDPDFRNALLKMIATRKKAKAGRRSLVARRGSKFKNFLPDSGPPLESRLMKAEQSNTSFIYDSSLLLKLYRRLEPGLNPDLELTRYLTQQTDFKHLPQYAGSLEYTTDGSQAVTAGLLVNFIPNEGDAWTYFLNGVQHYFEQALTMKDKIEQMPETPAALEPLNTEDLPAVLRDMAGPVYLDMAALLGRRTGQLHLALASLSGSDDVEPELFSTLYQKSVYQSMRALTRNVFEQLSSNLDTVPEELRPDAEAMLAQQKSVLSRFVGLTRKKISAMKIRIHGDYHLGQVLYTGKDFVIIDFEGEPARPLGQRRLKRSALRDIAGMVRSFHYAANGCIILHPTWSSQDAEYLRNWAQLWYFAMAGVFLKSYLDTVAEAPILPTDKNDFAILFDAFMLEKAVYELGYELNNRPDWLGIPLCGLRYILRGGT